MFLKQKSRVHWIKHGDGNNIYFFSYCRGRWYSNKILALRDDMGITHTSQSVVSYIAVNYFENLTGRPAHFTGILDDIVLPQLCEDAIEVLSKPFPATDVFKSMPKSKSRGPDGLTVEFFVASWNIIGEDVTRAILHFFRTLHLPRMINSTAIYLVPKVSRPTSMSHFWPISCCNLFYKCISKLLSNRLKGILPGLISPIQSAFIRRSSHW